MSITLRTITVFPVKSSSGRELSESRVEPLGLVGDRRWMLVDEQGECITARRDHRLLTVEAHPTERGLALSVGADPATADTATANTTTAKPADTGPGATDRIEVDLPTGEQIAVTVHGRGLGGIPAAPEASAWLGAAVGRPDGRLVFLGEPRPLNPEHSLLGDATGFADAYPVTLASMASLRRVQEWATESALERGEDPVHLQMRRFRPNLVIDGDLEPFAEDAWRSLRIGEVTFDVARIIDRCSLPTIDPHTLERSKEPIRSLARHRAWDGATWFGLQLIPRVTGVLRTGDEVHTS